MAEVSHHHEQTDWFGASGAILAVVFWSAGNLIVRSVDMPGLQIAFWRIALGAVVYGAALKASGRTLSLDQLKRSAPAGLAIGAEIGVFFVALKATTVANATLIGALQPIVLLAFGVRRFGERVSPWLLGTAAVALGGVGLVVFGSSSQPIWSPRGDVLAFVSMLLFAAYYVLAKQARATIPAFEFQTAIWVWGTVLLLPAAMLDAGGVAFPSSTNWLWLAILLAIPGTGHLLMNWAHGRVSLTLAAMTSLGVPILSTVGAALFLDEAIGGWQIPGIVVVVAALVVVITRGAVVERKAAPPPPTPRPTRF